MTLRIAYALLCIPLSASVISGTMCVLRWVDGADDAAVWFGLLSACSLGLVVWAFLVTYDLVEIRGRLRSPSHRSPR